MSDKAIDERIPPYTAIQAEIIETALADVRDGIDKHALLALAPTETTMRTWIALLEEAMALALDIHGGDDYLERRREERERSRMCVDTAQITNDVLKRLQSSR